MQFHEKLYTLRKAANMTQSDLAERLNVSRQAVSRWEMGTAKPEVDTLIAMSDLFGVTLDDLLKNKEDAPAQENPEPPVSGTSYWHYVPKKWWVLAVIGMGWKLLQYVLLAVTSFAPEWVMKFSDWANQSELKGLIYFISIPAMTIYANVFFAQTGLCFFWALVRWINVKNQKNDLSLTGHFFRIRPFNHKTSLRLTMPKRYSRQASTTGKTIA